MRVVAFGCIHGQRMGIVQAFLRQLLTDTPDAVVFLGDGARALPIFPEWGELKRRTKVTELRGDRDDMGRPFIFLDGVRYEHGHRIDERSNMTVETVRRFFRGQRVVHAHTHVEAGPWPLDVGSIAKGTYGEIEDGSIARIRRVGERRGVA